MVNIYVLKLEDGKYYVGKTSRDLDCRLDEHFTSNGAEWTKIHKPVKLVETFRTNDDSMENVYTKKYMRKYGIHNVRGGSYTSTVLQDFQIERLNREFELESVGLPEPSYTRTSNEMDDVCFRCGRPSHWFSDCYARTNVDGDRIWKNSLNYSSGSCFRCGRSGHWARNCYARYHQNGGFL